MDEHVRDDDSLIAVASRIDEDQPVNWDAAESSARDDQERAVIAELRVLAAMARVSRDPEHSGAEPHSDAVVPAVAGDPPARWGSLTLLDVIGRGAFGTVYRARDVLGRDVALKLFSLSDDLAGDLSHRVLREGSLLAKVKHPNVVVVHGVDQAGDCVGLWMELVHGRTMEQELKTRGALSADEARPIAISLCQALAAVHGRGLLHRDVKAQNVMREDGGRTVLMDFGAGSEQHTGSALDVAGTPLYLAPEIFNGQPATQASDIYSLGVLLYRMVTAGYPVEGSNRMDIARAHQTGTRRRLRDVRPDLPSDFVQAVERALAAAPSERYQTAGELETALTGSAAPPASRSSAAPSWWWPAATIGVLVLTIGILGARLLWQNDRGPTAAGPVPAAVAAAAPASAPAADTYSIKAMFLKYNERRPESELTAGGRLDPGDTLSLRVEASKPIYLYVVNADDYGDSYLLFPLPGREPANPLAPGSVHRLPGQENGLDLHWQVTSEGSREHLLVFATPTLMPAVDASFRKLPNPTTGRAVSRRRFADAEISQLRSIGGLVAAPPRKTSSISVPWFSDTDALRNLRETVQGAWVRQLTLENR